jgi:hypothetical protein
MTIIEVVFPMTRLVEVPVQEGGFLLVEMKEPDAGVVRAAAPGEIMRAGETLESALEMVKPTASAILKKMQDMPSSPDEISLQFGLGLKIDSSGILRMFVSAETNANFQVSFTWKRS